MCDNFGCVYVVCVQQRGKKTTNLLTEIICAFVVIVALRLEL